MICESVGPLLGLRLVPGMTCLTGLRHDMPYRPQAEHVLQALGRTCLTGLRHEIQQKHFMGMTFNIHVGIEHAIQHRLGHAIQHRLGHNMPCRPCACHSTRALTMTLNIGIGHDIQQRHWEGHSTLAIGKSINTVLGNTIQHTRACETRMQFRNEARSLVL